MVNTYRLTEIEQVVKVGTILSGSWFRGHAKVYGDLTPKLFRKQWLRADFESWLIENFKRGAPALERDIPDYEDHIEWLFLMQHHGMPTRLLDWTKSILIALYFVVSSHSPFHQRLKILLSINILRHQPPVNCFGGDHFSFTISDHQRQRCPAIL